MKKRETALGVALLVGALLASGLIVEACLRIYAGLTETGLANYLGNDPYAVQVEPHGDAGYRPRPGRTFRYLNGASAITNEMGYRGPAVEVPKPEGVFRVVLLGGSTTFGWGVNDDQTIDAHMRELFERRRPDARVDVINLAFDGYDSYQILERFRTDGLPLEPNFVIANAGINDVRNAWFEDIRPGDPRTLLYRATMDQLRLEQARGGPALSTRVTHYLYSARMIGWLRGQLGSQPGASAGPEEPPPYHWDALDYFQDNLRGLIELGGQLDSAVVLLSTPPSSLRTRYRPDAPPERSYWIRDAETTQMYRDSLSARLRALADEESPVGVRVVYVPHETFAPELFLDDAHLTSEGNRRVAEDFVAAIEPLLPR